MKWTGFLFVLACGIALGIWLGICFSPVFARWRGALARRTFKPLLLKPYRLESLPTQQRGPTGTPDS